MAVDVGAIRPFAGAAVLQPLLPSAADGSAALLLLKGFHPDQVACAVSGR
jgi:hypothetical protein